MEALPTAIPATGASRAGEASLPQRETTPVSYVRTLYVVASVERCEGPADDDGTDWCRYVLSCGGSRITGMRRGTLDEVRAFAASSAEDFNTRTATGKGKAAVAYTKKKALIPPR
jgi:hypothetical protein